MPDPRVSGGVPLSQIALEMLQKAAEAEAIAQVESEEDLEQWCDQDAFNPLVMMRRFRPLDDFKDVHHAEYIEEQKALEQEEKITEVEKTEESAARYHRNNYELQIKTLLILRDRINLEDNVNSLLDKVLQIYPDPALADEALDFLIENATPQTELIIRLAKNFLQSQFASEIKSGRNMGIQAREFSKEGLGSPTSLRDLYRDITLSPREPIALFNELSEKFPYDKMKTVINFLLRSLGSDVRSKGPSISRAELIRLIDEIRSLQGVLGIYRFFQSRMSFIRRQFSSYDIVLPGSLRFETLAKQFVKFLAERFISPEKIIQAARDLGLSEEIIAQIIIFTQMRDGLKQISPRYYRSPKQRDELHQAFMNALEELEVQLEEEEEEEEDNRQPKKKKK